MIVDRTSTQYTKMTKENDGPRCFEGTPGPGRCSGGRSPLRTEHTVRGVCTPDTDKSMYQVHFGNPNDPATVRKRPYYF